MTAPIKLAFGTRTIHAKTHWSGIPGDGASVTFCIVPPPRTHCSLWEVMCQAQGALERALTALGRAPATQIGLGAVAAAMLPWFREAEESGLLAWSELPGDVRQSVFICDCEASGG